MPQREASDLVQNRRQQVIAKLQLLLVHLVSVKVDRTWALECLPLMLIHQFFPLPVAARHSHRPFLVLL